MTIVFSKFTPLRCAALGLLLAPAARAAQVVLKPRVQSLEPTQRQAELRFRFEGGPQPDRWHYSVSGHPGARFFFRGRSGLVLHVPHGVEGLTLTVTVHPQGRPDLAAHADVVVLTHRETLLPEARYDQARSRALDRPESKGEPAPALSVSPSASPAPAGSPDPHPGQATDQGGFIRYGGTGGAVFAPAAAGGVVGGHWLVLDSQRSTLHRVSPGGDDERLLGIPNVMALKNGGPDFALLSKAQAIAPWPVRGPGAADLVWVIADTEAHALRWLDPDGNLETLGGNGTPGCQNGPLAQATFDRPIGVVSDCRGGLYVAEEGSAVVRMVLADHTVALLAGVPGSRRWVDGEQGEGEFTALRGIALDEANRILYVTDGHAVRAISLATGAVRTLLGRVDQPGGSAADSPLLAVPSILVPMLRDPKGLAFHQGRLWIADSGNGRIRVFDPAARTLATFPALPEVDGAFAGPGHLAFDPEGNCMVSAGSSLFLLTFPPAPTALPETHEDQPDAADPVGGFRLPALPAPAVQEAKGSTWAGDPRSRSHAPLAWEVDAREGSPAPSSSGSSSRSPTPSVQDRETGTPVPAVVPQRPSRFFSSPFANFNPKGERPEPGSPE